jgi:predicted regulator of Ras-like GTPase activity (Roadblock/LC7/MglB family)
MMAAESVDAVLRDLKTRVGGIAAALVSRNGLVLFADLPEGVVAENLAVMYATILGASTTANSELGRVKAERIVIEGPDTKAVLVESGENALLVVVVDASASAERTLGEATNFAELLKGRAAAGR